MMNERFCYRETHTHSIKYLSPTQRRLKFSNLSAKVLSTTFYVVSIVQFLLTDKQPVERRIQWKVTSTTMNLMVSSFEVYMDNIRDLLNVCPVNLSVMEDKDQITSIKGLIERQVYSAEETFMIFKKGSSNRKVGGTNMNDLSSRSHSIFTIDVEHENIQTKKKLRGKLFLVDLAGSESVSKSGAEGILLDEAKEINKSLSELGNVMNAIICQSPHIPYRNSKLTRILKESLGGNARTTMIVCCSPVDYNLTETKSTLQFAMRAQSIKNYVSVNMEISAEEWKSRYEYLLEVVAKLEKENKRWRQGENVDVDEWFTDYKFQLDTLKNGPLSKRFSTPMKAHRLSQDNLSVQSIKRMSCTGSGHASELFNHTLDKELENIIKTKQLKKLNKPPEKPEIINFYTGYFQKINKEMRNMVGQENDDQDELCDDFEERSCDYEKNISEFKILYENLKNEFIEKDNELFSLRKQLSKATNNIITEEEFKEVHKNVYVNPKDSDNNQIKEFENQKNFLEAYVKELEIELYKSNTKLKELEANVDCLTNKMNTDQLENFKLKKKIENLKEEVSKFQEKENNWKNMDTLDVIRLDIKSDLEELRHNNLSLRDLLLKDIQGNMNEKIIDIEELKKKMGQLENCILRENNERKMKEKISNLEGALNERIEKNKKMKKRLSINSKYLANFQEENNELKEHNRQIRLQFIEAEEKFEADKVRYANSLMEIEKYQDKLQQTVIAEHSHLRRF